MHPNLQILDILISEKKKKIQDDSYKQIQLPVPEPPEEYIREFEERKNKEEADVSGGVVILDIFGDDLEDSL